jgi:hypothetical protein
MKFMSPMPNLMQWQSVRRVQRSERFGDRSDRTVQQNRIGLFLCCLAQALVAKTGKQHFSASHGFQTNFGDFLNVLLIINDQNPLCCHFRVPLRLPGLLW